MNKRVKKRVLAIDIGGTHFKFLASGRRKPLKIPSGKGLTPRQMVSAVQTATAGWSYDVVSIGYPGRVVDGRPAQDAPNLGKGWVGFNFKNAFHRPVKIINDSAMQALGSYRGGQMLFLGLGTGLGSTLIIQGIVHAMELGDLPYREGKPCADFAGKAGRARLGAAGWERHVKKIIALFQAALQPEYTVLGGGEAQEIGKLPPGVLRGHNNNAFIGGFRLWQEPYPAAPSKITPRKFR